LKNKKIRDGKIGGNINLLRKLLEYKGPKSYDRDSAAVRDKTADRATTSTTTHPDRGRQTLSAMIFKKLIPNLKKKKYFFSIKNHYLCILKFLAYCYFKT